MAASTTCSNSAAAKRVGYAGCLSRSSECQKRMCRHRRFLASPSQHTHWASQEVRWIYLLSFLFKFQINLLYFVLRSDLAFLFFPVITACSTVLLPAKVVQALNLNFDDKGGPFYPRFGSFIPESGKYKSLVTVAHIIFFVFIYWGLNFCFYSWWLCTDSADLRSRNSNGVSYQKRNLRPQQAMSHEIRLPQEWTYWSNFTSGVFTNSVCFVGVF